MGLTHIRKTVALVSILTQSLRAKGEVTFPEIVWCTRI
jgi:hypothetical protein